MAETALETAEGQDPTEGQDPSEGEDGGEGQGPSPEVIAQAREMGWSPKENFRGDPEKWVDADEYVRRGEEVLPLVKAQNRKLSQQVTESNARAALLEKQLAEMRESISTLTEIQTREATGRIDRSVKALDRQIEEARAERETDKVLELQERRTALLAEKDKIGKPKEVEEEEEEEVSGPDPRLQVELQSWQEENDWYGKDKVRTRLMNAIATEVRVDPKFKKVVGREFLEECARRTDEALEEIRGPSRQPSKVAGGGARPHGSSSTVRGKSFNDLPADAKAAAEADIRRLGVGEGKLFKTEDAYRTWYTKQYFGDNE